MNRIARHGAGMGRGRYLDGILRMAHQIEFLLSLDDDSLLARIDSGAVG